MDRPVRERGPRLFGIPLQIHPSWLLAVALVVLAVGQDAGGLAAGARFGRYGAGLALAALLFASVLAHELAHALAARRCALPVERITIYPFGGAAQVDADALTPRNEALTAAAGPLASAGLGALFAALWWPLRGAGGMLEVGLRVLALVNGGICLLTLLPGYPLDGGRIVRALAWYLTDDLMAATRLASIYGQFLGWCLLAVGLFIFGWGMRAPWGLGLLLVGWFLRGEARRAYRELLWRELSKRLPTYHATFLRPPRIPARQTLAEAVDDVLEGLGQQNEGGPSVVVDDAGAIVGVLGLDQLRAVKRRDWAATPAGEAMVPRDQLPAIQQDQPLAAALPLLEARRHGFGLVVAAGAGDDDPPIGVVTKTRIVRLLLRRLREGDVPKATSDERRTTGPR